jgi:hypothetical protein
MANIVPGQLEREGAAALSLMEQALGLLDRCETGLEVGAHLDLAICRLRELLSPGSAASTDLDLAAQPLFQRGPSSWPKAS